MPSLPSLPAPAGPVADTRQTGSLRDFTDLLLTRCGADTNDRRRWQLLYYGVVPRPQSSTLMAIIAKPESPAREWITADLDADRPWPSAAHKWPALLWPEREVADLTGLSPAGHPDLEPILQPHRHRLSSRVFGAGVFSLPLGPVRADVSESGFFLFDTVGEQIMHLQAQLFFKRRGIEQLAVGKSLEDVLLLSERISGTATAGHASAYASAVEQAMDWVAPAEIQRERQLWLELERLYNHAHDLSQLASAAGMTVAQAQLARVKEELLRVCGDLTGSRYLRGVIHLFRGSGIDWPSVQPRLELRMRAVDERLEHFVRLLARTPTFVDRLIGTGTITAAWARDYALVGPVARACGVATDARKDLLPDLDAGYEICLPHSAGGDAKARFDVRVAEWRVSARMVDRLLRALAADTPADPHSPLAAPVNRRTEGWGAGCVEGPRGRITHVVAVEDGRVRFCGVRSASAWNWPVFGLATANGNIQTDFPVIDASFGLSYAGLDR